ncbi:MAG: winged helix-turn-helix transcriptional regulator [Candidatus Bathyarchaeia archaeon]|nr:winged helix-turn-helix transcriptional regulator [Candidatus Bathyarchaeia archaeon]MDI6905491.1 winged helix-turn-helix transcriptional regulator [Candidatus Bathyarchaeia archaeon]
MDEIDRKIISQLQLDGRTTLEKLAGITGLSNTGVKKRLNKLIRKGIVKVSTLIDVKNLDLQAAIVLMEVESSEALNSLISRFRNCPRVVNMFTTLGGYNLVALVVAEDRNTLESISIEKCSLRSGEGVRRSEFYPISDIYYSSFMPVREYLTRMNYTVTPCDVDCRPCHRYKTEKCVGCPTTTHYRGHL